MMRADVLEDRVSRRHINRRRGASPENWKARSGLYKLHLH